MNCPHCSTNGLGSSLVFPIQNLEMSRQVPGYLDTHGVPVQPAPISTIYSCTNGHVFTLQEAMARQQPAKSIMEPEQSIS